jgi:uncharacterized protein YprB with RNaseH-like and TPR domain
MLRQSFVILPGVRRAKEHSLWRQGIRDWNGFLDAAKIHGFSTASKESADKLLALARQLVLDEDAHSIAHLLPEAEHWRLYNEFKDDACFLDIETGELGEVTVIGMAMNDDYKPLLRGANLDKKTFADMLHRSKLLVTFNGRTFDVPVLEKHFGMRIRQPHIDMRYVCSQLGLKGGLKEIEKQLGIERPEELSVLRGPQAPELWRCWRATGDEHFLRLLIGYNREDCVNLQTLADRLIPQLWEKVRVHKKQ